MLLGFVFFYMLVSIAIGLYAARRVSTSTDYIVAGRSLPLYITIATVFATWFGSETVLGIPATFIEDGLVGVISDPFGASLCLILVGLIFAVPLYRMKLLTIGDFYKRTYGRKVELLVSICICLSYLGWVAAQVMALGLVFDLLTDGAIPQNWGMTLGLGIVLVYTIFGGMWSVALTDFIQMMMIVFGLIVISFYITGIAGGTDVVIDAAESAGKFDNFWPELTLPSILAFVAAWITMGFGSIPQQDVFQRVMSAKSEQAAKYGTIAGGVLYLLFAFIPIYLAYSAFVIQPEVVQQQLAEDSQIILPTLILEHTPVWVQIVFFGAVLSAIMSTASGTLLAPSVTFAENIARGFMPNMKDQRFLLLIRFCVLGFAAIVLIISLNSELSIFEMVENAYKVTLVGAIIPLFAGLFWKRANETGALCSITLGICVWLVMEIVAPEGEGVCPPQLAGLAAALIGMIAGSLAAKRA
jgi:SSS family solute:Na+ symporter